MAEPNRPFPGSVQRYLADVRRIPQLTRKEERRVAREVREGRLESVNRLVEGNLAFVIKLATEYRWTGVPFEDLINAGNLGLLAAARRFDVERNVRFTTYAGFWIRKAILEEVADQSRVVSVPNYQAQLSSRIRKAERALRRQLGRSPDRDELADHLAMTIDHLERVLRRGGLEISLDDPVEESAGAAVRTRLADPSSEPTETTLHVRELRLRVKALLRELNDQQRAVMTLRYGLGQASPSTLAEIGSRLSVSRERVRQIEHGAIRWLRSALDRAQRACTRDP